MTSRRGLALALLAGALLLWGCGPDRTELAEARSLRADLEQRLGLIRQELQEIPALTRTNAQLQAERDRLLGERSRLRKKLGLAEAPGAE